MRRSAWARRVAVWASSATVGIVALCRSKARLTAAGSKYQSFIFIISGAR